MIPIEEIREKMTPVFKKYGVARAQLFGSVARGEATAESDIDILVRLEKPISVYTFFDFNDELESVLGRKVDLMTEGSLNKFLKPYILPDLQTLYEVR